MTAAPTKGQAHQEQRGVARAGLVTMQFGQVRCMVDHQRQRFPNDPGQAAQLDVRGAEVPVRVPLAQAVEDLRSHAEGS